MSPSTMETVHLVPLECYLTLSYGTSLSDLETAARTRWLLHAAAAGLLPAWPSVVARVSPWGVHVRGLLWRPALHAEATPAP